MNIDELIERAHAQAVKSGWWPEGNWPSVAAIVNNFHAEISEAWEEWRAGRMHVWHMKDFGPKQCRIKVVELPENGEKPEGFWVEIADLVIRLCDTMGAYDWKATISGGVGVKELPNFIFGLHHTVDMLLVLGLGTFQQKYRAQEIASDIIGDCFETASRHGVDLWHLIDMKMKFTATRPARHGGKRA